MEQRFAYAPKHADSQRYAFFTISNCFLFLGILLLSNSPLLAQRDTSIFTSSQLFETAWEDPHYLRLQRELDFFDEANLTLPLLEEIELRTKSRDFILDNQEYTTRFEFNSFRQRKVQNRINEYEYGLRAAAQEEALDFLLYDRYALVLDLVITQRREALLASQSELLNDRQRYVDLQLSQYGESFTDDWLKLKDDQLKLRIKAAENQQEQTRAYAAADRFFPLQNVQLTADDILPADVLAQLGLALPDTLPVPARLDMQALEVGLAQVETQAEKAANSQLLQFLQVRYRGDREPTFEERVSIGAAVRLPLRNTNSIDEQYRKLNEIEEDNQLDQMLFEFVDNHHTAEVDLRQALAAYQFAKEELTQYETTFGPNVLQQQGIQNIETLFIAREGILQRQAMVLEREAILYRAYLQLLHIGGCLTVEPYQNWLTNQPLARF